ncbi:MAG: PrsW family glutamic-type intramembrane protease [Bacteroidales bacterium]|nr:PrsW family glutamic-type intramembrane protease [Bacteroidales bacterium]MDD4602976.1 PrsW family glutamic-type intramembrane protease [Bacteroidales bacterium]
MRPIAFITLVFAPAIALGMYIYFSKRNDKAFSQLLMTSYLAGAAGITVLILAEGISLMLGLNDLRSLKRILFFSFITIGGSSELGKFIFFRYYIVPKNVLNKPIHGITFSIMVSLGFSTLALILFMVNPFKVQELFPFTLYSFVIVPANMMFAVIMGFFVGMAKFMKTRFVFSLTGLLVTAIFHGIFNFCILTSDFKLLSLFSFGFMVIVLTLGLKAAYSEGDPL